MIPHNARTMTLFELATAGIPVTVPSARLFHEWINAEIDVLPELSFFQVLSANTSTLPSDNPNKVNRPDFYQWWMSRADFFDQELMPNVRTVDSLAEAVHEPHPATQVPKLEWSRQILDRNQWLSDRRYGLLNSFYRQF